MNQKNIVIIGTLEEVLLEYKGASGNFPVLNVKIGTGEKFYQAGAVGDNALAQNDVLESLPIHSRVRVTVTVGGRRYNEGAITEFNIVAVAPDFGGVNAASGVLTGYVKGVTEVPKKDGSGTFSVPKLGILLRDRDGIVPNADLELRFPRDGQDAALADWKNHEGQYVEVQVDLDAFITQSGRSRPNYMVKKITYHPMPITLAPLLGLEVEPENDLADAI